MLPTIVFTILSRPAHKPELRDWTGLLGWVGTALLLTLSPITLPYLTL